MNLRRAILPLLILTGACFGASVAPQLQDPWDAGYSNLDATGPHVLGCWKFDDMPQTDASGRGISLSVHPSSAVPDGRFYGGLKGSPHVRTPAALPHLSPNGAFSAEMWVKVTDSAPAAQAAACLLDKQGPQMEDFCWSLLPADERGLRQIMVRLGYGAFVKEHVSIPVALPLNEWRHLAFTYDGAGKVVFFVDSQTVGESFAERCGATQPGPQPLSVGATIPGNASFPGVIDEVRLCSGVREFAAFALEIIGTSHVWERLSRSNSMQIRCANLRKQPLRGMEMTYVVDGVPQSFIFPDLAPGAANVNEFGPDTALKPGTYTLEVVMGSGTTRVSRKKDFKIIGRSRQMFPVIMDGVGPSDLPWLAPLGCTHWAGISNDDAPYAGTADRQRPPLVQAKLEEGLLSGLKAVGSVNYDKLMLAMKHIKVGRDGKEYSPPELNVASPEAAAFMFGCGNMFTVYYRANNLWSGVMIESSLGKSKPGFSAKEQEAYRTFSGQDIPAEVQGESVNWRMIPGFPENRMVSNDHPILKYYRWLWSEGNGWKELNDTWRRSYDRRKQDRDETWIMHHPSVRQPSKAGAYSLVTNIGDQSMDSRNPLLAGLCADQQVAMRAAHGTEMGIYGIVPLSWERSLVSPPGAEGTVDAIVQADRTAQLQRITMASAILKENVWMTMSRPVKALVLTDGFALRPAEKDASYNKFSTTHPQARSALSDVAQRLLLPLGPMLARRQALRSPVVMLESFTSQVMAGRGLYCSGSPSTLAAWQALQHAHIQAELLYEETLLQGGLDDRKVLFLTDCDVLPVSVVEKIRQWQETGGKVIADEHLCSALKADVVLTDLAAPATAAVAAPGSSPPADNSGTLAQDLPRTQPLWERLAQACKDCGWQPALSCDSPDIILHASKTGEATCLFVMNDRREAGTYVGQHGKVMESGLPVVASLNLGQEKMNVYDLTQSRFLLPKREDSGLIIPLQLGPAEGRVLLLSPSPLIEMQLDVPVVGTCGNVAEVRIGLTTSGGSPMPAAIPVEVTIRDADGAPAEFEGYHVVDNGELILRLDLARNETPGIWEVRVRELASGMEAVKWMRVSR
ncbi:LamG domain-containing protein [Prosthecobacter sp.]|uniref:LamG domain-containing protein n=1 Tax=Prosthecobacter sp. TaxID=1965333 RepID=UPI003784EAC4